MRLLVFFRENTDLADPLSRSVFKISSKTHDMAFPFWTLSRPEQIHPARQSQRIKPARLRLSQRRLTHRCCAGLVNSADSGTRPELEHVSKKTSIMVDSGKLAFDFSRSAVKPIPFGGCRFRDARKCLPNA